MEELWQKISGWLLSALLLVGGGWVAMFKKRSNESITNLQNKHSKLIGTLEAHNSLLIDHDKRISEMNIHMDIVKGTLSDIKGSISTVHQRIDEKDKRVNEKLDRLIERKN